MARVDEGGRGDACEIIARKRHPRRVPKQGLGVPETQIPKLPKRPWPEGPVPKAPDRALGALKRMETHLGRLAAQRVTMQATQQVARDASDTSRPLQEPPYPSQTDGRPRNSGDRLHQELMQLATTLVETYDYDQDGALCLSEARALYRAQLGLLSRDDRKPLFFDDAAFQAVCRNPSQGLLPSDLAALLHISGGSLGPPKCTRPHEKLPLMQQPIAIAKHSSPGLGRERLRHMRAAKSAEMPCSSGETVKLAQIIDAVRTADSHSLAKLLEEGTLWGHANPLVPDEYLRDTLGTDTERYPLLWIAALVGDFCVWRLLVDEIARHGDLEEALLEDVEGWILPLVLCLAPKHASQERARHLKFSTLLLTHYFDVLDAMVEEPSKTPSLSRCLLRNAETLPLKLLLSQDAMWPVLVELMVSRGGGFPHDESAELMGQVGLCLVERGCAGEFIHACREGGDAPRPGTTAFAGLFRGLLLATSSNALNPEGSNDDTGAKQLEFLHVLLDAGLELDAPLTHDGTRALHMAARHNSVPVAQCLLALRVDMLARDSRGRTPMDVARIARSSDIVRVLQTAAKMQRRVDAVIAAWHFDRSMRSVASDP